ncbi:hypothetical protein MAPG_00627 [Magnaporthiopsis poae ATCC 64411]|uniref:Uncharacterized protein n=1 Tax=Magnaporthiopsis poae (strain ATCC 64411 / 73-15) TaxID=644358 RepID=A0A0C4DLI3_MAGP6|nr:hypothetical protein MAPG_00627 [Magnaporthiopsis poae ATCC 64411]
MPSSIHDAATDSMSSPDPLNDFVPSSVARVTRSMARGYQSSLRSQRQSSTTGSPRKQTFELDVGNELSPQKILVTVEAEGGEKDHVTRRLFPSSAVRGPRSAARRRDLTTSTTTTTVPLRGLTDDEHEPVPGTATPRRRGRPRKSGTPMPSSKKRAGTPIDRSPNRNRRLRSGTADSASERGGEDVDATPRPAAKFRKTPGRKGRTPSKKDTRPPKETGTAKKRGRPRRQALVPAEMEALADQDTLIDTIPSAIPTEPTTEDPRTDDTRLSSINMSTDDAGRNAMDDEDIWLAAVPESGPAADTWRASSSVVDKERRLSQQEIPRAADVLISDASSPDDRASVDYTASGADRSDAESETTERAARSDADIDTIAQGEDFSMILMDSIVSFRESMQYAEAALPEMGDATSLIVDRALEPIRQGRTDKTQDHSPSQQQEQSDHIHSGEGDTSSVKSEATAPAVQTTAAPELGRIADAPRNDTSLAPPNANNTTTLSANSPRRGRTATPLSKQLALKSFRRDESLLETPDASRAQEVHAAPEEPSVYDDSFSEIPEGVLDAATPRPLRRHPSLLSEQADEAEGSAEDDESDTGRDDDDDHDDGEGSMENDEKAQSAEPTSMTPPPADGEPLAKALEDAAMASDDDQDDELRSSPPALVASADEPSRAMPPVIARDTRKDSTESPEAAARSSPLSPRQDQDGHSDNLDLPSLAARPALSPIVRVGRALQHVTSDPPSPKGADGTLGSPFRSSVSRDIEDPETAPPGITAAPSPEPPNGDATPEPSSVMRSERSWTQVLNPLSQIKSLVSQGAQMFSPRTMVPQAPAEDPFAPDSEMPSPKAAPKRKRPSIPLGEAGLESITGSTRAARDEAEDAMDWEAPETVVAAGSQRAQVFPASNTATPSSPVSGHRNDLRRHHSGRGEDTVATDVPVEEERLSQDELEPPEADEDDDIWAFEASRPTPSPAKPLPAQEPTLNLWSRAKLPSPWAKTATPRVASESEEFSLLSVQERDLSEASLPRPREQSLAVQMARTSAARVDLSNFFSSPAVVPRLQPFAADGTDDSAPSQPTNDSRKQLLGSVNPPLQQAVARESIAAGSASQSQNPPSSVAQKAFQPNGQRRLDLFSPAPPRQLHVSEDARPSALSQRAPPKPLFPKLPQKRNFAPHVGSSGGWMFAPVSSGAANHHVSAEDTVEYDERRHESSDAEPDEHESSFVAPTLKPLPNRAASPAKSCLRSPLKPKTPGRVVEFTSSTLSPLGMEQGRALHGLPQAAGGGDAMDLDSEPVQIHVQRPAGGDLAKDENNRCPSTSFGNPKPISALHQSVVLAPPTGAAVAAEAAAPRLSQTQWSRAHWVRMDALLQERRKGSLNFQLQHRVSVSQKRRSVALLGKHVSAQGESMALGQWHLDVVDAFRTELGAGCVWDEHVLSKRLFALLVGEERRRAAKGGRPRPLGTIRSSQAN